MTHKAKNAAAVSLGKRRLKSLSPERRREIAILGGQAAKAAWDRLTAAEQAARIADREAKRKANRIARQQEQVTDGH